MRNLDECQAEVFRRSEKRIRQRRQRRNHILMACIPLVLCITLFSAFLLSGIMSEESRDPGATEAVMDGLTGYGNESLVCSVARIEVSGRGVSLSYTEVSDILLISDRLGSYAVTKPESNGSTNEETKDEEFKESAAGSNVSDSLADSVNTGYTITLVMHEGDKTAYYLAGNTLTNQTTNQTYTLSQKQVNELKDLLGIPHQ